MSGGPIPFTAIAEFAKIYEVEDFFEFLDIIRIIDNVLLRETDKRSKKEDNGKRNSQHNGKGRR